MKRRYIAFGIIIILLISLIGYLIFAHQYFYHRLHSAHLIWPDKQYIYSIDNTSAKNVIYVALGDSLTAGVGATSYEDSYPYLIAQQLANKNNVTLIDRAYPGFKTTDLINQNLTKAIGDKPDIITLLIGVNDLHSNDNVGQFKDNYKQIVSRLDAETKAKIYLIAIPYIGARNVLLPPYSFYYDNKTRSFNKVIKDIAIEFQATYVDLYSPTVSVFKDNGSQYSIDGYHPSSKGYKIWADVINHAINQ